MAPDSAGLAAFVEESYPRAFRTAWLILHDRADAEDAVQEAFLRAWRFRAAVRDEAAMRPWLYRVLVNTCYSQRRTDARRGPHSADGDSQLATIPTVAPSPDDVALLGEVGAAVRLALAALPQTLRIVVVLRYYAGLSEKEIAGAIRRRPGTVKSRLHEARRLLAANPALASFAEEAVQ